MTEEQKKILLKDLSARVPYGIKIRLKNTYRYHCDKMCNIGDFTIDEIKSIDKKGEHIKIYHNDPLDYEWYIDDIEIEDIKPYLRPMSSMTKDELKEFVSFTSQSMRRFICEATNTDHWFNNYEEEDWLDEHHFDYRGLIERGLALPAPEGMYNNKK